MKDTYLSSVKLLHLLYPIYRTHKRKTVSENKRDSLSTDIEDKQDNPSQTGSTYEALRSQIDYLQKALESEQTERREKDKRHDEVIRELNQSTERFQAMLMQLQNKNAELNQKLLAAPVERQDFPTMKEKFEEEEVSVVSNQNSEPVPEQPVQSQRSWITPIIWAFAAALLTISAVELGGLSVGNLVRDLLVTR